ncbi:Hypothetical protein FKW44_019656 [Caligus rogercresseyi]|uniref:Uncharacterized protein n=1 Tax=Caligus rogercresseyi TaxID=217165 RepID=A0A7T8JYX9_CALRO|nr:Hypothetical protein FKW44_019656 [Caligus rogercresseyi]
MVNFYSMCPPPASTPVSTRDLNALTDLDTSAASKDMAFRSRVETVVEAGGGHIE